MNYHLLESLLCFIFSGAGCKLALKHQQLNVRLPSMNLGDNLVIDIRKILKLVTPPILIESARILINAVRRQVEIKDAYQDVDFINHYIKSHELRKNQIQGGENLEMHEITRGLGIMLSSNPKTISVLDFGGGAGSLFYVMRQILPQTNFNWAIIETANLTKSLLESTYMNTTQSDSSKLNIYSSIDEALSIEKGFDVVIASGSLQYIQDPYKKLMELIQINSKVLQISRMPMGFHDHLLTFTQSTRLSENGPARIDLSTSDKFVNNSVYIPSMKIFKNIISQSYSDVIIVHESTNVYPNTQYKIDQYSIIAVN